MWTLSQLANIKKPRNAGLSLWNNGSHHQSAQTFTQKQGQYLEFIHSYTLVNVHAPAQANM